MLLATDDHDIDRISFIRSLRAARRSTRAGLSTATHNLAVTLVEIVHELFPVRRFALRRPRRQTQSGWVVRSRW